MRSSTCRESATIRRRMNLLIAKSAEAAEKLRSIGQPVTLTEDNGSETRTVTLSLPWQLGNGAWVVKVRGKSGGYCCERIRPNPEGSAK